MYTIIHKTTEDTIQKIEEKEAWYVSIYILNLNNKDSEEHYQTDILTNYLYKSSDSHHYRLTISGIVDQSLLKMIYVLKHVVDIEILDNTVALLDNTRYSTVIQDQLEKERSLLEEKYSYRIELSELRKLLL